MPEVLDDVESDPAETINIVADQEAEEEESIEPLPEPIKKEPIPTEDIFKDAPAPIIAKPKKKRTMTPAMKEKLALARIKGNETRKRNKEARLKGEMPTPTQKKAVEKEIQEEKKRPVVNNIVHETKNITNNITHDDIEKIVNQSTKKTLEAYDTVRKERKAAKQIVKQKELQQAEVKKTIMAAQGYAFGSPNFYANCF